MNINIMKNYQQIVNGYLLDSLRLESKNLLNAGSCFFDYLISNFVNKK